VFFLFSKKREKKNVPREASPYGPNPRVSGCEEPVPRARAAAPTPASSPQPPKAARRGPRSPPRPRGEDPAALQGREERPRQYRHSPDCGHGKVLNLFFNFFLIFIFYYLIILLLTEYLVGRIELTTEKNKTLELLENK
jgi:hypothetical protein